MTRHLDPSEPPGAPVPVEELGPLVALLRWAAQRRRHQASCLAGPQAEWCDKLLGTPATWRSGARSLGRMVRVLLRLGLPGSPAAALTIINPGGTVTVTGADLTDLLELTRRARRVTSLAELAATYLPAGTAAG
jgi:hypothetical protein